MRVFHEWGQSSRSHHLSSLSQGGVIPSTWCNRLRQRNNNAGCCSSGRSVYRPIRLVENDRDCEVLTAHVSRKEDLLLGSFSHPCRVKTCRFEIGGIRGCTKAVVFQGLRRPAGRDSTPFARHGDVLIGLGLWKRDTHVHTYLHTELLYHCISRTRNDDIP